MTGVVAFDVGMFPQSGVVFEDNSAEDGAEEEDEMDDGHKCSMEMRGRGTILDIRGPGPAYVKSISDFCFMKRGWSRGLSG